MQDALGNLVKRENLQDFTCSKTKIGVRINNLLFTRCQFFIKSLLHFQIEASRRISLEDLPPVLILHLKYFVYDSKGGSQKLTKSVEFSENLEITKGGATGLQKKKGSSPHEFSFLSVVCCQIFFPRTHDRR